MKHSEKNKVIDGIPHRKCKVCNEFIPNTYENFAPANKKRNGRITYGVSAYCRPCHRHKIKLNRMAKEAEKEKRYKEVTPQGIPILPF